MIDKKKWGWFFEPLSKKSRARLELTFGVVMSGAAVVGLSTFIRPDPSKYIKVGDELPTASLAERRREPQVGVETPAKVTVPPAFLTAASVGDIATMERLYVPTMPLESSVAVAAEAGETNAVRWLLDHGADVHADEITIDAPVLVADEHPDTVALLLQRGANEPALATASLAGASNAVRRMLAAHVPVNGVGTDEPSPIHEAIASTRASEANKRIIVDMLFDAGADPNREETEAAITAAVNSCGIPLDGHLADKNCLSYVDLLVKHGARAKGETIVATLALPEPIGDTAFDAVMKARMAPGATAFALTQTWTPTPRQVKVLVKKRVDWAFHDGENDAAIPLVTAVQRGDRDYVKSLIDAGAPVDTHFKEGTCALGEAIGGSGGDNAEYARIVELLVARGADVNRRLPDGRTPLFAAAESGNLRIINALIDRGARLNDLVLDDTALDAAEQNGQQPAARVLHSRGARRARKPSGMNGAD